MVSEHVVLGPDAGAKGVMGNPRDYAYPGNQDPFTPWPGSLTLLGAIASATTTIRLAAAAVLAPLRRPLALARHIGTLDLLSEGRLVVQPTVSWSRDEYAAMGVPFEKRGAILDEHLEIWDLLWRGSPVSYAGTHFSFEDVYIEPRAYRPDGPRMWFGGQHLHERLLDRLVKYGHGFHPVGRPTPDEVERLKAAMSAVSTWASSSIRFSTPSATACRSRARSSRLVPAQAGKARRAAATAASTSAAPPRAISASGLSPIGETSVNVPADRTRSPPIQCPGSTATPATVAIAAPPCRLVPNNLGSGNAMVKPRRLLFGFKRNFEEGL